MISTLHIPSTNLKTSVQPKDGEISETSGSELVRSAMNVYWQILKQLFYISNVLQSEYKRSIGLKWLLNKALMDAVKVYCYISRSTT